ncbi:MAG: hypothetical protein IJ733_01295 [Lachnospiraceae bacterium]|nr:hypothetical protein [Lachnospiraceae bacterium]
MNIQNVSSVNPYSNITPKTTVSENDESKTNSTTTNTDRVDKEIERLKEKKQKIEQQIRATEDDTRKAALQIQLRQIEMELSEKDNDAYRRQNAVVS